MEGVFQYDYKWKRPSIVPFPYVWCRFQMKLQTGNTVTVRIEDLTPERHDEVWKIFADNYLKEEPLCKVLRLCEDEASIASVEREIRNVMRKNASLIAVLDEPGLKPKIVGLFLRVVISRSDVKEPLPKTVMKPVEKYNYINNVFRRCFDVFNEFNCDTYFEEFGVLVMPEFRGQNVAEHILSAGIHYGKTFGIGGEVNLLVNPLLLRVVKRLGLRELREIMLKEFRDKNGNPLLPGDVTGSIKLIGRRY